MHKYYKASQLDLAKDHIYSAVHTHIQHACRAIIITEENIYYRVNSRIPDHNQQEEEFCSVSFNLPQQDD